MKKILLMLLLGISIMSYGVENLDNGIDTYFENSYEDYMDAGEKSYEEGNYTDSLEYYLGAFKVQNDDLDALFGVAKSYEGIGKIDEALGVYRKILKLDPNNLEAHSKKLSLTGENLSRLNYEEKEKYFEEYEEYLKKSHYSNSEDIYSLGRIYMNDKSFERAYNVFKRERNNDYRNLFGAATTARFLGRYDTAITYYGKLLREKPDFYRGYLGLGATYQLKKNYDKAILNFKKYLTYQEDENVYVTMANIYMAQEEYGKAKDILEDGQVKFPNSTRIRKSLGEIYSRSK